MADRDFAAPGRKYAGKLSVGSGPVPLQRWTDRDRPEPSERLDMRGESPARPKEASKSRPELYDGR